MLILFTIGVILYSLGVRVAAFLGNAKAKQWVEGRRKQKPMDRLKGLLHRKKVTELSVAEDGRNTEGSTSDWVWFHAASLGEFEQGRPVIEALKKDFPQ